MQGEKQMPDRKNPLPQEQKIDKPKIDDVIGSAISGEKLKNAKDFIAFLKERKLNFSWRKL